MEKKLTVRSRGAVVAVPLDSIVYLENEGRKIRLHTQQGEYLFYGTFREVLPQLDGNFFLCSRSYILNREHIQAMRNHGQYEIIMDNGDHISLSKNLFLKAKHEFDVWLNRNLWYI